jgi:hypothetical protein
MGGEKWEAHGLRSAQAQKKKQDAIIRNKLGMVGHVCNLSYLGGGDRRITV